MKLHFVYILIAVIPTTASQCCLESKNLACEILEMSFRKEIGLATQHGSGIVDEAFAFRNMNDTCYGKMAHRSNYQGRGCLDPAPGCSICLDVKTLRYIIDIATAFKGKIFITEIAGGCHTRNISKHYKGLAVNIRCQVQGTCNSAEGTQDSQLVKMCNSYFGGLGIDEKSHIHCQFDTTTEGCKENTETMNKNKTHITFGLLLYSVIHIYDLII